MDRTVAHSPRRRGFTLTELLVVIGIMVLLATMTIGAINLGVTTEIVRGGARQVQSLIEGARDRAIYAGDARGIRLLVDDADPTICRTIVYVGSSGEYESEPDGSDANFNGNREEPHPDGPLVRVANPAATGDRFVLYGIGTRFSDLAEQKLIRGGTRIRLGRDSLGEAQHSTELLTLHPASVPVPDEQTVFGSDFNGDGINNPEILILTTESAVVRQHSLGVTTDMLDGNWHFAIETEATVLPAEEASILPRNCCIDLETSHLPSAWVVTNPDGTRQYSNRMDLLFTPGGAITGSAAGSGLIHLHVCHTQDAIDNVPPGSQTLDGMPNGEPRQGEEFGVTIFTQSGRVNVHPIDWAGYPVPAESVSDLSHPGYWQSGNTYAVGDRVAPTLYDGNTYVAVVVNGPTGGTEPRWNRLAGGATREGNPANPDVIWRAERHNVWKLGLEGALAR